MGNGAGAVTNVGWHEFYPFTFLQMRVGIGRNFFNNIRFRNGKWGQLSESSTESREICHGEVTMDDGGCDVVHKIITQLIDYEKKQNNEVKTAKLFCKFLVWNYYDTQKSKVCRQNDTRTKNLRCE